MKSAVKLGILQWTARILGLFFCFIWGLFYVEHMEWFKDAANLPPAKVFFGQIAHLIMLLGYLIGFRRQLAGSICIICGAFILFSRINNPVWFITATTTALLPAILYLVHWWHTERESSMFYRLVAGGGDKAPETAAVIAETARWFLRIAAVFTAGLVLALHFAGETFMLWFNPEQGWSVTMSEGFPNPFAMGGSELTAFSLSLLAVAASLYAWFNEWRGGLLLCVSAGYYGLVSPTGGYPLAPAGVIIGALFVLLASYERIQSDPINRDKSWKVMLWG